jgi:Zn-dependent protease with chaperone function
VSSPAPRSDLSPSAHAACPECGAAVASTPGWTSWCPTCNWNLTAGKTPTAEPRTRFERAYVKAGARIGRRLGTQLEAARDLEPSWTVSKVAAVAIAVAVHLLAIAIFAGGVLLVLTASPPAVLAGLVFLGVAWLMRPRLAKVPDEGVVTPEEAPTLYALAEQVAASLDTRPPDLIVINGEFNAYWSVAGIRRKRVLGLGLPLFDSLGPQARVALIGHEIGHGRNGDVRRGLIVGSAISSLAELYYVLSPGGRSAARDADVWVRAAEPILNALMYVLTRPVAWLLQLQAHLVWHDSQRAEYLADALAARVAGSQAEVASELRLLEATTVDVVARRAAHAAPGQAPDLFAELRDAFARTPDHERIRLRRTAELEQTRLNATHPPLIRRLELVERRPVADPAVTLSTADSAQIDTELSRAKVAVAAQIIDEYRNSLYRGARRRR